MVNFTSKKMKMSFVWVIVAFISCCLSEEVIRELRIQSNNDDVTVENEPLRLVGTFGIGSVLVFLLLVINLLVYYMSYSCHPINKVISRTVCFAILLLTGLVLWFAPKSSKTFSTGAEPNHYDYSIIPRITISLITIMFGVVAAVFLVQHLAEPVLLSTLDHEHNNLWIEH